jgi:hypothetical protein
MRRFLVAATVLLAAGCGSVESLSFRTPPPTPGSSTTTAPADLTGAGVNGVDGGTVGAVPIGPGLASLSGIALGPQGPVGGATVHVDRLVGDAVGSVTVSALPDGTWTLPGILGGRYRVRAWQPPDLDMTAPQIFFLGGTENRSLTLQLQQFGAANVAASISPNPPVVDAAANLLVQITAETVDTGGVVHAAPVSSASVLLSGGAGVVVGNPNPTTTTASGLALWQLTCLLPGPPSLSVMINNASSYSVDVPDCSTTAASPGSTSTTTLSTGPGSSSTSLTPPPTPAPSTTTTIPTTTVPPTTIPSTTSSTRRRGG